MKGERDKALAEYDRALAANPKQADAYVGRGLIYQAQGKLDQALAQYDRALAITPKHAEAIEIGGGFRRPPLCQQRPTALGASWSLLAARCPMGLILL
jgi:Tfp pilus assembly protein PilF